MWQHGGVKVVILRVAYKYLVSVVCVAATCGQHIDTVVSYSSRNSTKRPLLLLLLLWCLAKHASCSSCLENIGKQAGCEAALHVAESC